MRGGEERVRRRGNPGWQNKSNRGRGSRVRTILRNLAKEEANR